jgi:hypothetical protein
MKEEKVVAISLWATKADAERYDREFYTEVLNLLKPYLTATVHVTHYTLETTICRHFVEALVPEAMNHARRPRGKCSGVFVYKPVITPRFHFLLSPPLLSSCIGASFPDSGNESLPRVHRSLSCILSFRNYTRTPRHAYPAHRGIRR